MAAKMPSVAPLVISTSRMRIDFMLIEARGVIGHRDAYFG